MAGCLHGFSICGVVLPTVFSFFKRISQTCELKEPRVHEGTILPRKLIFHSGGNSVTLLHIVTWFMGKHLYDRHAQIICAV